MSASKVRLAAVTVEPPCDSDGAAGALRTKQNEGAVAAVAARGSEGAVRALGNEAALWADWVTRAEALDARFDGLFAHRRFWHHQPLALQAGVPARLRRAYDLPVAYLDWRPRRAPERASVAPASDGCSLSRPVEVAHRLAHPRHPGEPDEPVEPPGPGQPGQPGQPGAPAAPRASGRPVEASDFEPPTLICLGGVANTAARFAFLAADLARAGHRVLAMDWLGRGQSGWLADEREYRLATLVEQLRQFIAHLALPRPPVLLGSSLGGSVGIALAAAEPALIGGLVLNDVGPHMPRSRRQRRAHTLARWYVFRSPAEIQRRVGAAQKNDGPVSDEIRHFLAWHQTRWSAADAGRVYCHDPRALLAYRRDARHALDQWADWRRLHTPLLVLHGLESDALLPRDLQRMRGLQPGLSIAHIPHTGHTPVLSDRHQTALIGEWLRTLDGGSPPSAFELSVPHAAQRACWVPGGVS